MDKLITDIFQHLEDFFYSIPHFSAIWEKIVVIYGITIIPFLFGVILLAAICRVLVYILQDHSPKNLFAAIVFLSLCLLYFIAVLQINNFWRDINRIVMLFAFLAEVWYECVDLVQFIRKKNELATKLNTQEKS